MATRSTDVQTGFLQYSHTIGLSTMQGRGYYYPADTAVGRDGRLYTVSRSLEGDPRGVRVTIADLDADYHGTFASFGEGDGELVWPTAIAIDGDDRFYVADEYTNRVTVYDPSGEFMHWWGVTGAEEGQLDGPSGLAFDLQGHPVVVDHQNHRVQRFTRDGQFLSCFGARGSGAGQLELPWGVTVAASGEIYVADWGNDRVQRFTPDGDFLAAYGTSGEGDGELHRPAGVAVDGEGYIYIADWGNHRVQVLDPDGVFLENLRGEATNSKWAEDFLDINLEEAAARAKSDLEPQLQDAGYDSHDESWHVEKYFWAPKAVTLDRDGRLYVTESNRHRIQIYTRVE